MKYRLNGKFLEPRELERARDSVVASAANSGDVSELFESDRQFDDWVSAQGLGDTVDDIRAEAEAARREVEADRQGVRRRHESEAKNIRAALKHLAEKSGYAMGSPELFRRATTGRPSDEPKIFGSAFCYDQPGWSGAWLPVNQSMPDFSWFSFEDRASSVVANGRGVLYEHAGYTGRKYWLLATSENRVQWLGWFDGLASSAYLLG